MSEKDIIHKLSSELDFERSKRKTLQMELQAKEQECEELKNANKHIEHNKKQKADKLMRIEKLITARSTGYTDEFIQEINCYKYTSSGTNACEEFTFLDEFVPNILANNILQKIGECEVENAK
ncbi:MAG: hypothetical protein DKM23_00065 [Candidatus Melainabacteria bacterium]|nr:MAG: hypothetical protein DKM23_00065 [Candidatus Melainabacteria bacterium]